MNDPYDCNIKPTMDWVKKNCYSSPIAGGITRHRYKNETWKERMYFKPNKCRCLNDKWEDWY